MTLALPVGQSILLRTFFGDDLAWSELAGELTVEQLNQGNPADLTAISVVDDLNFRDATVDDLVTAASSSNAYVFVVDETALQKPEHLIMAVDVRPGRPDFERAFRVTPEGFSEVEPNLRLANIDFADFWNASGPDGVYRAITPAPTSTEQLDLTISDVRNAINRSKFPSAILDRFLEALEDENKRSITVKPVTDLTPSAAHYRDIRNDFAFCEEVLGLDETIKVTSLGGNAMVFSLSKDRALWTVYFDLNAQVVIAALLSRMPGSPWAARIV